MGADVSSNINGVSHQGFVQMLVESNLGIDSALSGKEYARHAKTLGEDGWELLWISVNSSFLSKSQVRQHTPFMERARLFPSFRSVPT